MFEMKLHHRFTSILILSAIAALAASTAPAPAFAASEEAPLCEDLTDYLGYPVHPRITYYGLEICAKNRYMWQCTSRGWRSTGVRCGSQIGLPRTWYVDDLPGGPGDGSSWNPFRDIQDALDAAADGDRVYIRNGKYKPVPRNYTDPTCGNCDPYENPRLVTLGYYAVGKQLVVEGQSRDGVVLSTGAQYGFLFEHAGTSIVRNLTLTDGDRGGDDATTDAALLARYSNLLVQNLLIEKNVATVGGGGGASDVGIVGIAGREGAVLTIENSTIQDNSWDGIALYRGNKLGHRATAYIENNVIRRGPATRGGGIGVTWDSAAIAKHNLIDWYQKGVVAVGKSIITLENNVIRNGYYGVGVADDAYATMTNNIVIDRDFGVIAFKPLDGTSTPIVWMTNNVVARTDLGVLVQNPDAYVDLRNNIIASNKSTGVKWAAGGRPALNYNLVYDNPNHLVECNFFGCFVRDFGPGDLGNLEDEDPLFTDPTAADFTLMCTSPAIDAGDPSPVYDDADGTRNDMGAHGGPGGDGSPSCGPLEILTVPSDGTLVTSADSYPSSQVFRIEVEGTYKWGGCDPINCPGGGGCNYDRFGDARWETDTCWNDHFDLGVIGMYVDGGSVTWGPYTSEHLYDVTRIGNDGPFTFRINDCANCYGDNEGELTVRIYAE